MKVSEYFKLNRAQASLDFLDVDIKNDIRLYIDPSALKNSHSSFLNRCEYYIQNYFETLLEYIINKEFTKAKSILLELREPNETHLGQSVGKSQGRGLGSYLAGEVLESLKRSQAVKTGLLKNLEETALLIEGVGHDIISDIVTNIIRGLLIKYTQQMCEVYGIPLVDDIAYGPIWNVHRKEWEHTYTSLPIADGEKLLLVPKVIVRKKSHYDVGEYYNHYVLEFLKGVEHKSHSALVELLKNGKARVTKKSLKSKYGTETKKVSIRETLNYPKIIEQYREVKNQTITKALEHEELAIIEKSTSNKLQEYISDLVELDSGKKDAYKYEDLIEKILSIIFYPWLMYPTNQTPLHDGRKRIDITYTNVAKEGFFDWVANHYSAQHIFFECKNYSADLKNPEFDQLAGRFSPTRGQVGFLTCRKNVDVDTALKRAKDASHDRRGYIMILEDEDIIELGKLRLDFNYKDKIFTFLKTKFDHLIM